MKGTCITITTFLMMQFLFSRPQRIVQSLLTEHQMHCGTVEGPYFANLTLCSWMDVSAILIASFIKLSISDLFRNGESGVKLRYCSSYIYQPSCVTVIPLLFKQKK